MFSKRTSAWSICILVALYTACSATGATWYVDDDAVAGGDGTTWATAFETIQAGIDASTNGDSVLVSDGTYTGVGNRDLRFYGKAITLTSQNGPEVTVINCESADGVTGVLFDNDEIRETVLDGFTITRADYSAIIISASPTIRNCWIQSNTRRDVEYGIGGGVRISGGSPCLENCIIKDNRIAGEVGHSESYARGAGVSISGGTPLLKNCLIKHNSCSGSSAAGGGVWISGGSPYMENCRISENSVSVSHFWSGGASGAGVYIDDGDLVTFVNCVIESNSISDGGSYPSESMYAGVNCGWTDTVLTNCTIANNYEDADPSYGIYGRSVTLFNCIVWEDRATLGILSAAYRCCFEHLDAENVATIFDTITEEPLLTSDYRLQFGSSCIDAGFNSYVPEDVVTDLAGAVRFIDEPLIADTGQGTPPIVDVGAYEFGGVVCGDGTCDIGGDENQCTCPEDCGEPSIFEEECSDGIDNDCDGMTDEEDVDCTCGDGSCNGSEDQCTCPEDCGTPPGSETDCHDRIDNDCDGLTDREDEECASPGDADFDGDVDLQDFAIFQECWGSTTSRCLGPFDVNVNGQLDYTDLSIFEVLLTGPVSLYCSEDSECDDGFFCNGAETCQFRECGPGEPPCTVDEICFEETEECVPSCDEDSDCDDGLFCNGEETCNGTFCLESVTPCAADEVCLEETDECVPSCDEDSDCDDGLFCNGEEACNGTFCLEGVNPCDTYDICDEDENQCVPPCDEDSDCDDGLYCNGSEYCWGLICLDGTNPCGPDEVCLEETDECVSTCYEDSDCDDGLFCNGEETCEGILCHPGTPPCGSDLICFEALGQCDTDCNANEVPDAEDVSSGSSTDTNANDIPDECEHVYGGPMLLLASKNSDSVVACNPNSGDGIGYLLSSGFAGLDYPNGFAADQDGNIYISSAGTDSIIQVSYDTGEVIRELSGGGLDGPVEMVLTEDTLLVASYSTDSIKEFDLDTGLWVRDAVASETGGLNGPTGMLRSGQDTILVSSEQTNQVLEFNYVTGEFVRIAAEGGTLATPADLLFDLEGNLLVASLSTDSVIRYAPDGTCMGEFIASGSGGLDGPQGMQWLSGDLLLVASRFGNKILKFDAADGSPLGVFAEPAGLDQPTYMMVYGAGLDAMVWILAGEFQMGDTFAEGNMYELPVHDVHIDGFYIQKHEVTNQQYAEALNWALGHGMVDVDNGIVYSAREGTDRLLCMSNGVSNILWDGTSFSPASGKENHPMQSVSWYGAASYANWRNLMEGRPLAYSTETWECLFNDGYRLPTEAEWEKAARGGATGTRFPWSDSNLIQHQRANYYSAGDFSYDTSPTENYHPEFVTGFPPYTNPVIYFEANNYSLFGMAGNVSEWCNDYYDASYYSNSPYENPQGPASGNKKVVRGGSWQNTSPSCRNAVRNSYFLTTTTPYTGFRLVFSFGG